MDGEAGRSPKERHPAMRLGAFTYQLPYRRTVRLGAQA
jgi:hypothetical protein